MQAVVMAGGTGSRMGAMTAQLPKALLPIGNGTLVGQLLDRLAVEGASEFVICIGQQQRRHIFHEAIGTQWQGIPVSYVTEDQPLGTAGCLALVEHLAPSFIVVNCDIITGLPFSVMQRSHLEGGAAVTVATGTWTERLRFGTVQLAGDDRIANLEEKPEIRQEIVLGAYVLNREPLISFLPAPTARMDMPDLLMAMIRKGEVVKRFYTDAAWQDVGTPADYERARHRAGQA